MYKNSFKRVSIESVKNDSIRVKPPVKLKKCSGINCRDSSQGFEYIASCQDIKLLISRKKLEYPLKFFVHTDNFWTKTIGTVDEPSGEYSGNGFNGDFKGSGDYGLSGNGSSRVTKIEAELSSSKEISKNDKIKSSAKWYNEDDKNCPFRGKFEWTDEINRINYDVFNNRGFRPMQLEIINSVLSGHDTFALVPTGGGKSLCYQLPAVYSDGITLVVSPLISLIQDQVQRLVQLNISCCSFSAEQEYSERRGIVQSLKNGEIKVVFVTPEKIVSSKWFQIVLDNLYTMGMIFRFVIDEAHCISHWGSDFRPDYAALGVLRKCYPKIPILLLTATATITVFNDLIRIMNLNECNAFCCNFNRPNLIFKVMPKSRTQKVAIEDLIKYIKDYPSSSGIVYCLSCQDCEIVANELRKSGIESMHYHAQLDQQSRKNVQDSWMSGKISVVVATLAFGMGIDKSNVRFVIHFSMPKSIENYFQEAGRAGRDGKAATCIVMYDYKDSQRLFCLVKTDNSIKKMIEYCENPMKCRRVMLLEHFGQKLKGPCDLPCDNCKTKTKPRNCREVAYNIALNISKLPKTETMLSIIKLTMLKTKTPSGLKGYLSSQGYSFEEAESLLHYMVIYGILYEYLVKNDKFNSFNCYIKTSNDFVSKLHFMESLHLRVSEKKDEPKKEREKKETKKEREKKTKKKESASQEKKKKASVKKKSTSSQDKKKSSQSQENKRKRRIIDSQSQESKRKSASSQDSKKRKSASSQEKKKTPRKTTKTDKEAKDKQPKKRQRVSKKGLDAVVNEDVLNIIDELL